MDKKDLISIKEGLAEVYIFASDQDDVPSKAMDVFYNKKMEINRDITNLVIKVYNKLYTQKSLIIVDCMAASGISSIRMLKECENIKKVYINDINPVAIELIHENIALNNLKETSPQIEISRKDANLLFSEIAQNTHLNSNVLEDKPNIISIDPFGTPNLYIDSALKAIQKKDGLICITATDTAVLFGLRPNACIRKYMAKPLHTEYCKEIGARILIYFLARMANINKLGIIPLLTFYSKHFIRLFALTFKDKKKISECFKEYGYLFHCNNCGHRLIIQNNILNTVQQCPLCGNKEKISYTGPLWINKLHDKLFLDELILMNEKSGYLNTKRIHKILEFAREEINMPVSYYNIHRLSQDLKLSYVPSTESVLNTIRDKNYIATHTHFDFMSIKTDMNINLIKNCLLDMKLKNKS